MALMVKIIEMFIPKSNKYTRPGIKMTPTKITIHETDNTNVRANAFAHARLQYNGNNRQASWHLQVDDEPEVYQSLPFNEVGYHAGSTQGNNTSIGIEICVNRDGNYKKAVDNAIEVVKWLIKKYPSISSVDVVQHNYWSGKHCPRKMREGYMGVNWDYFIKEIRGGKSTTVEKPKTAPPYKTTNTGTKLGQTVTLKKTATHYATGEKIPDKFKGKKYTIQQRGSNRVLLKELYSWVKISDLEGISGGSSKTTTSKSKSGSSSSSAGKLKVGSKVTLSKNASKYSTGQTIPTSVKGKQYTVQQVKGNTVLLKEIYSWVYAKDVGVNTGTSTKKTTKSNKNTGALKVGSKVTLSKKATKYATGQTIPTSVKGKTYTVQQVKGNQVLLKEIYSWVYAKDVGGSTTTSSKSKSTSTKPKTFKVGQVVTLKKSASKFATGQSILNSVKGKRYKILQVKSDRVLLDKIMSWVKKSDVE